MNDLLTEIEELLISDNGIALSLRFQEKLNNDKVTKLFNCLDLLKIIVLNDKSLPIWFMGMILDFILVVNVAIENEKTHQEELSYFLDEFMNKIRSLS